MFTEEQDDRFLAPQHHSGLFQVSGRSCGIVANDAAMSRSRGSGSRFNLGKCPLQQEAILQHQAGPLWLGFR
jgi:hypothetical protein